jgi:hypothetical protein
MRRNARPGFVMAYYAVRYALPAGSGAAEASGKPFTGGFTFPGRRFLAVFEGATGLTQR